MGNNFNYTESQCEKMIENSNKYYCISQIISSPQWIPLVWIKVQLINISYLPLYSIGKPPPCSKPNGTMQMPQMTVELFLVHILVERHQIDLCIQAQVAKFTLVISVVFFIGKKYIEILLPYKLTLLFPIFTIFWLFCSVTYMCLKIKTFILGYKCNIWPFLWSKCMMDLLIL